MKKLIYGIIILFFNCLVYGQSNVCSTTLDTALIKVKYERLVVLDTLKPADRTRKDYITLQAGTKAAVFYFEERRLEDSIMCANKDYALETFRDNNRIERLSNLEKDVVVRRHDLNQTWVHQRFDLINWIIYENLEKPVWSMTDETDCILGFQCYQAHTFFRGREWIAFFTTDIPIPEGPWKLYGLPGLILKAYDSKRHYIYEAKGIDTKSPGLVEYINNYDRLVIKDRVKGLQMRKKSMSKDIGEMIRAAYSIQLKDSPQKNEMVTKQYDFEETDYPHNKTK
jgi:GLPGLI family protein